MIVNLLLLALWFSTILVRNYHTFVNSVLTKLFSITVFECAICILPAP